MEVNKQSRLKRVMELLSKYFCATLIKRILCALMLALDMEPHQICEKLGLTYKSVKRYESILESEEYETLLLMGKRKKSSELDDYKDVTFKELDSGAYKTLREIAVMIKGETGVERSRNRIQAFLRRNGYKPLRVGFFPCEGGWGRTEEVL